MVGSQLSEAGVGWLHTRPRWLRELQGPSTDRTRPADILINSWVEGTNAVALDVTVPVSPLNLDIVDQAGLTLGLGLGAPAAEAPAMAKHRAGDVACMQEGWFLCPLVVANEFGGWGSEAEKFFRTLAARLGRKPNVRT
jgi:hypothetical protein